MKRLPVIVMVSEQGFYLGGKFVHPGNHPGCIRTSMTYPAGEFICICGLKCSDFCAEYARREGAAVKTIPDSLDLPQGVVPNRPGGPGSECPRSADWTGPVLTVINPILVGGKVATSPGRYVVLGAEKRRSQILVELHGGNIVNAVAIQPGTAELNASGEALLSKAEEDVAA